MADGAAQVLSALVAALGGVAVAVIGLANARRRNGQTTPPQPEQSEEDRLVAVLVNDLRASCAAKDAEIARLLTIIEERGWAG